MVFLEKIQIAIDGPAGAGKSSVAKILAKKLGYLYIDTGAMYRALTYSVLKNKINPSDTGSIIKTLKSIDISFEIDENTGIQKVYSNKNDVTDLIRTPEVNKKVSTIAAILEVREIMVERQRQIACLNNIVMDGRDVGTVVLPDAKYKFYLTATLMERAKRREIELREKHYKVNLENLIKEIEKRDEMDMKREHSPLKPAHNAVVIDTTNLNLKQVVEKIIKCVKEDDVNVL